MEAQKLGHLHMELNNPSASLVRKPLALQRCIALSTKLYHLRCHKLQKEQRQLLLFHSHSDKLMATSGNHLPDR